VGGGSAVVVLSGGWNRAKDICILVIKEVILDSSPCREDMAAAEVAWWRSKRRLTALTSRVTRWRPMDSSRSSSEVAWAKMFLLDLA
jgi:hypothetical protein